MTLFSMTACRKKTTMEKEPNDRYQDATVIEAGIPVTGTLSSATDIDFFKLAIEESASFDISLSRGQRSQPRNQSMESNTADTGACKTD